ncbi:hypothetical protein I551_3710 [Mycobacterium ulcerans str. Harvey]|uniref:Uncharacterized protein n=1 Tax=Mycobacterium ulcerans str. Harvey TaxID=1299332 RepID=A0ABP3AET5_MYCUL|nr:hypothetical protein I551_3710 [Mycobacterium ulcerans str. Harvey]
MACGGQRHARTWPGGGGRLLCALADGLAQLTEHGVVARRSC